jgi:hypothetical protein
MSRLFECSYTIRNIERILPGCSGPHWAQEISSSNCVLSSGQVQPSASTAMGTACIRSDLEGSGQNDVEPICATAVGIVDAYAAWFAAPLRRLEAADDCR